MEEEQGAIERLRHRSFLVELPVQTFTKRGPAGGRNAIDRSHPAARHALLCEHRDQAVLFELPHRVIERADVHIGVALDHRRLEATLDFVRVKIAPMQYPENERSCVHSLIKLMRFE